jgi:hypothetical protein
MFKIFYNAIRLSMVVMTMSAGVILLLPHDPNNYMAAAKDKYILLQTTKSPRVILIGGSNVAFSVDSQKIEEHFGVPVTNMGLHANLGLKFMLSEVQQSLTNGDIVIISPEYNESLDGSAEFLAGAIKYCPECISAVSFPSGLLNVAKGSFQLVESDIVWTLGSVRWGEDKNRVYDRRNFNQWGDFIGHLDQPNKTKLADHFGRLDPSNSSIQLLNSFYRSCRAMDAQVFFIFPGIPSNDYFAHEKDFIAINKKFRKELDITILGTPQDFIFPDEYFYDTVYHMNAVGRDQRTDRIIKFLSTVIENH